MSMLTVFLSMDAIASSKSAIPIQLPRSLGTPVRDAAAYVCWAISRAYTPEEVAPYIAQLAPALLTAAVLDREVRAQAQKPNCVKTASNGGVFVS